MTDEYHDDPNLGPAEHGLTLEQDQWAQRQQEAESIRLKDYASIDYVLKREDWAETYLHVANAVNLAGVSRSFAEMVLKVRREADIRGQNWQWADRHPILVIYQDTFAKITGLYLSDLSGDRLIDAYALAYKKGVQA